MKIKRSYLTLSTLSLSAALVACGHSYEGHGPDEDYWDDAYPGEPDDLWSDSPGTPANGGPSFEEVVEFCSYQAEQDIECDMNHDELMAACLLEISALLTGNDYGQPATPPDHPNDGYGAGGSFGGATGGAAAGGSYAAGGGSWDGTGGEWAGTGGEWAGTGGEWAGTGGEWAGTGGEWAGTGGGYGGELPPGCYEVEGGASYFDFFGGCVWDGAGSFAPSWQCWLDAYGGTHTVIECEPTGTGGYPGEPPVGVGGYPSATGGFPSATGGAAAGGSPPAAGGSY